MFRKVTLISLILFGFVLSGMAEVCFADMVALYKFEGNANDSSGNNHHGIEKGNPSYVAGVSGQAIALDGKNSYVDCGTDASFDIRCQITVACWIKVSRFDRSWQTIIARGDNSWRLQRAEGNNTLEFACSGLVMAADPWIYGSINVNDDRWHHIAGVYDGARMYLYVDGVLDVSQEALGTIDTSTAPVYIGDNAQEEGRYFHGLIDELVIFDHVLNADEVKQLYRQGATSVTSTADAVWSQVRTAVSNIKLGNETAAEAATERLLGEFSGGKDVESELFQVAETYRKLKKYNKARQIYQYIVDNRPESNCGLQSQLQVVALNMQLEDNAAAETAIDKLLIRFAEHTDIAKAVDNLKIQYCHKLLKCVESTGQQPDVTNQLEYYDKMIRKLCGHILANWPDSEYAMWAQSGIAFTDIHKGDYAAAEAAINKLLANYPQHEGLAQAFYWLGKDYRGMGKYEKAIKLYQYIVDNWPESEWAVLAQMDVAISNIELGNDTVAEVAIDKLIADFNGHPDFPAAISHIEEQYYIRILANEFPDSNSFTNPVAVWEKSINARPDFFHDDPDLYYFIADCYRHLGDYENAIQYYQKVVDHWPDDIKSPAALYSIICLYEKLERSGQISTTEAATEIRYACEKSLADYPDSRDAKEVRKILQHWSFINTWLLSQRK